jgi:hypothetical protein
MPKKKLSKIQKQLPKIEKLKFIEVLEEGIDVDDVIKALKDIKKNGSVSWDKVKFDLGI